MNDRKATFAKARRAIGRPSQDSDSADDAKPGAHVQRYPPSTLTQDPVSHGGALEAHSSISMILRKFVVCNEAVGNTSANKLFQIVTYIIRINTGGQTITGHQKLAPHVLADKNAALEILGSITVII